MRKFLSNLIVTFVIAVIVLITGSLAFGENVDIRWITAKGTNGLTCSYSEQLFLNVKDIYNDLTIYNPKRKNNVCRNNEAPVATLNNTGDILYWCFRQLNEVGYLTMVLAPPISANGTVYVTGTANKYWGIAVVNAGINWPPGTVSHHLFAASIYATAHELGHLLGARHDNSNCNIMHRDALSCVASGVPMVFNGTAKRQMAAFDRNATPGAGEIEEPCGMLAIN